MCCKFSRSPDPRFLSVHLSVISSLPHHSSLVQVSGATQRGNPVIWQIIRIGCFCLFALFFLLGDRFLLWLVPGFSLLVFSRVFLVVVVFFFFPEVLRIELRVLGMLGEDTATQISPQLLRMQLVTPSMLRFLRKSNFLGSILSITWQLQGGAQVSLECLRSCFNSYSWNSV